MEEDAPMASINVTPLVDVMLVLLVIFMITAPMMQQGVEVNLPKTTQAPLASPIDPVIVSVDKNGKIFLGEGNPIDLSLLAPKVKAVLEAKKDAEKKVYIKGDTSLNYGSVMEIMGKLHEAGITQIGLVSAPADTTGSEAKKG